MERVSQKKKRLNQAYLTGPSSKEHTLLMPCLWLVIRTDRLELQEHHREGRSDGREEGEDRMSKEEHEAC